jgi:hypothetical protein
MILMSNLSVIICLLKTSTSLQTEFAVLAHQAMGQFLKEGLIIIIIQFWFIQFLFINVPSQQPDGQLQNN